MNIETTLSVLTQMKSSFAVTKLETEALDTAISIIDRYQNSLMQDWISVNDELPPNPVGGEDYPVNLVTTTEGDVMVGVYRSNDNEWWTRAIGGEYVYTSSREVVAWIPFPKRYTVKSATNDTWKSRMMHTFLGGR